MSEFGQSNGRPNLEIPPGLIKKIIIGIILLAAIALGSTTFYTIEEHETAAVLTFGQFTGITEQSGLHFKAPYPIQKVITVPAKVTQQMHVGYRIVDGVAVPREDEALMITGDENIVSADAVVEWKITDVEKYLFAVEEPEVFLRNSTSSAIRSVMGSTNLDFAITSGKTELQGLVKEKLILLQDLYQTGIFINDIKFQDIEPPEGEVQQAFKEVTNAREEKNTKINNAKKYANDRIPKARGEAQALLEKAEAIKESRILNALGDVAKFNAIYGEYLNNPTVTESRLILETLEQILPNAQIFITSGSSDTVNYLPLNELMNRQGGGAQ